MSAMNNNIRDIFISCVKVASPYGCAARGKGSGWRAEIQTCTVNGDSAAAKPPGLPGRICLAIYAPSVITLTRRAAVNGVTPNEM